MLGRPSHCVILAPWRLQMTQGDVSEVHPAKVSGLGSASGTHLRRKSLGTPRGPSALEAPGAGSDQAQSLC